MEVIETTAEIPDTINGITRVKLFIIFSNNIFTNIISNLERGESMDKLDSIIKKLQTIENLEKNKDILLESSAELISLFNHQSCQ
jgi:hypothetical protein